MASDKTPKRAEALPAFLPCFYMASENPDVLTTPTLETTKNNGTKINN